MALLSLSPLKDEMPSVKDANKDPREFHASDMRYLLGKADDDEEAVELLEDFVGAMGEMVRAGEFRPKGSEVVFGEAGDELGEYTLGLSGGRELLMRGKIDRLDVAEVDGRL